MDTLMWFWILLVVISGFGMMIGIELLMIRLGIRPADPDQKAGGMRDVAERVNRWSSERRKPR